ncbi:MAG: transcription antitermination factor NusB [Desulfofustis sp.]|nr:transcription antitermination factor NusB [Desulfofustis sp.]MBT8353447.1 transcription antitermination factor NusB [Desulfofustis sp.]NNK56449.1 transcription antitermination factor NusB [Desulfofustis sp.]
MGTRRRAREAALQFLFQDDFLDQGRSTNAAELDERFGAFSLLYQVNKKARPYARALIGGIFDKLDDIDGAIRAHATNWRLERIAATDRNLLRVAIYELLFQDDVPAQVAINEAVEIAKRFGTQESPAFVNGVLDAVQQSRQ